MGKNLSERIADRLARKPKRSGQNKAAFLAVRDQIKQALDDGWSMKIIWETLHEEGSISFGYHAFVGYVNRLAIRNKSSQPSSVASASAPTQTENPAIPKSPAIGGFTFQSNPNKEDLL